MGENSKRQSNFELLRIYAMIFIVLNHLCQHGLWFPENCELTTNYYLSKMFYGWTGHFGNWIFILLSGYFLPLTTFSLKKVFKLWIQIFSISVIIGLFIYFSKISIIGFDNHNYRELGFNLASKPATIKDLLRCFFPVLLGNNWFASSYILFYLFSPFLSESLKVLDQKKHLYLVLLMIITGTVIYMIYGQEFIKEGYLFYFIMGFYIANYIRIYNPKIFSNQIANLTISLSLIICFILWTVIVVCIERKNGFVKNHFEEVFMYPFALNRFPILLTVLFFFNFFKNLNIKYNRFINTVAGTTFGIYLIHENRLLNKFMYHRIFNLDYFINSRFLILYMLLCVIVIFAVCSLIEFIRQKLFKVVFKI